jgi:alanine-synthesizing transaminase
MRFSLRSAHEGRKNALSIALEERRARGQEVIDLTVSNPTTAGIPYEARAIQAALAMEEALVYEPAPFGLPSAREAVGRHLQVDPSRVVLTASTSEAYAFLFKALCDPGDEVLVPAPSYPLFDQLAAIESVRLVPYRIAYDGAWHLDASSLERTARAILVVSPNNPTGNSLTTSELAVLRATSLPIICDEVFSPYAFRRRSDRVECAAREAGSSLVFSLGGLSKLAALPQMKLGWIVVGGPEDLAREALDRLEWIADAFLSVGAPIQHALPRILEASESTRASIRRRLAHNLETLRRTLDSSAATVLDVEGGWYAIIRLPATRDEEAWTLELLSHGYYVHPGHFFDMDGGPFVVVSLLTREADLERGAEAIGYLSC